MELGLGYVDIGFFIFSLAMSVVIGVYFVNKNKTLDEYMLGGRNQKLLPVSVSMMTSFMSGLTVIGNPAENYHHGIGYATNILAMVLSIPFSTCILLPIFHRLECISIFQYLELRYNSSIKRLISVVFMLQMTLYNAVVLYVPSLSLQSVFGISEVISIGSVGVSCLIYCTLGGLKAIIWTDFFQAGLMFLAIISVLIGGLVEVGGWSKLLEINNLGQRTSFETYFNLDLTTRHTIYTIIFGATIVNIFMNGANQIQVQRALSLPSLRLAQWSQVLSIIFMICLTTLASSLGLILYGIYNTCDPYLNGEIDKRDAILIYYINSHFKYLPGLRGIFIAGVFAATLSTLSSFQNSMSALLLEDFIKPMISKPMGEKRTTLVSKILALAFGTACISMTFVVGRISGLLQVAVTLFGAIGAPFITAFFMGMLTRFTNSIGIFVGMLCGFVFGIYIQLYQTFYNPPLEPTLPLSTAGCLSGSIISANSSLLASSLDKMNLNSQNGEFNFVNMSYLWLPFIATMVTISVSTLVSLLTGGWSQEVDDKYLVSWKHKSKTLATTNRSFRKEKDELVGQMNSYIERGALGSDFQKEVKL